MPFPNESTQFKPGESGNSAGSSKKQRLTNALIKLLDEKGEAGFIEAGFTAAVAGDFNFWRYIFDRIDGKIPDVEQEPEADLKAIAERMLERNKKRGKPDPNT